MKTVVSDTSCMSVPINVARMRNADLCKARVITPPYPARHVIANYIAKQGPYPEDSLHHGGGHRRRDEALGVVITRDHHPGKRD